MSSLKEGAIQAVRKCMKITKDDKVVIVSDRQSKGIGKALMSECKKITSDVKIFYLEDFGARPLKKLPLEIKNAVAKSSAVFYTASSEKGEKNALRLPIIKIATKHGRQAHMPDITQEIMKQGMCTNYDLIKKVTRKIYNTVRKAKEIRVKTARGTELVAKFNPKFRWMICDGDIPKTRAKWSNLPDGEVATCVKTIKGTAVIDGCIGDYIGRKYGLLDKMPLYLTIKNGRIVKVECKNKKLVWDIEKYMKQDKNSNRIGEFALGTNIGLKKLIGNLLQDEKFPGVHIAIGSGYPQYTGAKWDSKAHCDCVIKETTVWVDGKKIMEKGKYLFKIK